MTDAAEVRYRAARDAMMADPMGPLFWRHGQAMLDSLKVLLERDKTTLDNVLREPKRLLPPTPPPPMETP